MGIKRAAATVGAVAAMMAVTVPAASADEREPQVPPGMGTMHELMMGGNPGMARMHELMMEGNPGMARMHELMMDGAGTLMHPGR
ncbi:MAG: hypothetical protein GEV04_17910 [Actinophytocola sp.]|nr:hypothetical protein [Actinophytocola sp.]